MGTFDTKAKKGLVNNLLDFQYFEVDGKPTWRYKTSEYEASASITGNPYRTTQDPGEIINNLAQKYRDKSGEYLTGWEAFLKANDMYDYENKTIDLEAAAEKLKVKEKNKKPFDAAALANREKVLAKQKALVNTRANLDQLIMKGHLPLLPKQQETYDKLVKALKGERPTNEVIMKILETTE